MLALSEREALKTLLTSLREMQTLKCHIKENLGVVSLDGVPIFPVDFEEEDVMAQMFIQFCCEGFNELFVEQYMSFYMSAKLNIVDKISEIVSVEHLDDTMIKGFFEQNPIAEEHVVEESP